MPLRLAMLVLAAVIGVGLSVCIFTALTAWRLDQIITAAKVSVQGSTLREHLSPEIWVANPPFSLPFLLQTRDEIPCPANPGALGRLFTARPLVWSLLILASAAAAAAVSLSVGRWIGTRRWRLHATPIGEIDHVQRTRLVIVCLDAAMIALLLSPVAAALLWYFLADRDLSTGAFLTPIPESLSAAVLFVASMGLFAAIFGASRSRSWLSWCALISGRCPACGYECALPRGGICPECGTDQRTAALRAPSRTPRLAAFLVLIATMALLPSILSPSTWRVRSPVLRWIMLRVPEAPPANQPPTVGGCRIGEILWVRWSDAQAYIAASWAPVSPANAAPRPGRARVVIGAFGNGSSDSDPQAARIQQCDAPSTDAEIASLTADVGGHPLRVRLQPGSPGTFHVEVPDAIDFFRYPAPLSNLATTVDRLTRHPENSPSQGSTTPGQAVPPSSPSP